MARNLNIHKYIINTKLMKTLKHISALILIILFSSCTQYVGDTTIVEDVSLEQLVSSNDLWYVDYNRTTGNGEIPYMSKAFTLSFKSGILYANNNIADIGKTGNGLGIDVGTYNTFNGLLEINHDLDGFNDFEISVLPNNELRIYNFRENVSYYLVGYQRHNFDYDKLFYDNIEYFLQEYTSWERITTNNGQPNNFDNENYLAFTPENNATFYSSASSFGSHIADVIWDYTGNYEVFDIEGYDDLKFLTLFYDSGDTEEFKLSVINDRTIRLYHIKTKTTYKFYGANFVQFLKGKKNKKDLKNSVSNNEKKRTKIVRKIKIK